jgi:hypothetical protein
MISPEIKKQIQEKISCLKPVVIKDPKTLELITDFINTKNIGPYNSCRSNLYNFIFPNVFHILAPQDGDPYQHPHHYLSAPLTFHWRSEGNFDHEKFSPNYDLFPARREGEDRDLLDRMEVEITSACTNLGLVKSPDIPLLYRRVDLTEFTLGKLQQVGLAKLIDSHDEKPEYICTAAEFQDFQRRLK